MSDKDQSAIASYERMPQGDIDSPGYPAPRYHCTACCFHGDWMAALQHHVQQRGHQIELHHMSHWGPVEFPKIYIDRMQRRLAAKTGDSK